jgi:hypothetical protein
MVVRLDNSTKVHSMMMNHSHLLRQVLVLVLV